MEFFFNDIDLVELLIKHLNPPELMKLSSVNKFLSEIIINDDNSFSRTLDRLIYLNNRIKLEKLKNIPDLTFIKKEKKMNWVVNRISNINYSTSGLYSTNRIIRMLVGIDYKIKTYSYLLDFLKNKSHRYSTIDEIRRYIYSCETFDLPFNLLERYRDKIDNYKNTIDKEIFYTEYIKGKIMPYKHIKLFNNINIDFIIELHFYQKTTIWSMFSTDEIIFILNRLISLFNDNSDCFIDDCMSNKENFENNYSAWKKFIKNSAPYSNTLTIWSREIEKYNEYLDHSDYSDYGECNNAGYNNNRYEFVHESILASILSSKVGINKLM